MLFINFILDIIHRISHPGSLPNDVAKDLGLGAYGRLSVNELLKIIQNPSFRSNNLKKFMYKGSADLIFKHAARKDIFKQTSRFSYFFNQGLLEFVLHFDNEGRLRRTYAQFHGSKENQMTEIQLEGTPFYTLTEKLSQQ